jgi:pyruvate/2-oxoglutarate dehydrogenase complex dihydrolipoamide acyltransferase (E2) component
MADERVELRMPNVGNGVESATVDEWLVEVGEAVTVGDPVVTMETDKASSDLEAPVTGTLVEVVAEDGTEVEVGELIGVFERAS